MINNTKSWKLFPSENSIIVFNISSFPSGDFGRDVEDILSSLSEMSNLEF